MFKRGQVYKAASACGSEVQRVLRAHGTPCKQGYRIAVGLFSYIGVAS